MKPSGWLYDLFLQSRISLKYGQFFIVNLQLYSSLYIENSRKHGVDTLPCSESNKITY